MKKITQDRVLEAFAGESQAHVRYLNFAERAEKDGRANVARLFQAAAYSEQIHAGNHLRVLDGIRSTAENLATALAGETFEVDEMYPVYKAVAEMQGEKKAIRPMDWALAAEKVHADLYTRAKMAVEAGNDLEASPIWVCNVCGYTMEEEMPDVCPICGARHDKFRSF
jgi:rubrerythrin